VRVGLDVEAFDEGAVVEMEDLQEKLDGGVLLELEALTDGAAGIEHDADAKGRLVCWVKCRTATGGRPSSSRPKFSCWRPVMKWPFLSVTVKIWLTSSVSMGASLKTWPPI
jgi:hypothetical protein